MTILEKKTTSTTVGEVNTVMHENLGSIDLNNQFDEIVPIVDKLTSGYDFVETYAEPVQDYVVGQVVPKRRWFNATIKF